MKNISLEYSYHDSLDNKFFSKQSTYSYPNASLEIFNNDLALELDLDVGEFNEQQLLNFLLGYSSQNPIAQAYAGHQFGHFNILGDGRAILMGEFKKPNGELIDLHIKGSGQTDYSRNGDGKATLSSMLREYIVSEAIHGLNIPTSRILAVIKTGENIQRQTLEQGAIAVRVCSTHIRVGTFQYATVLGEKYSQQLLDYTLDRLKISTIGNKAVNLINYVIEKQSSLIVNWMRVGFIHGVMNTDNMCISGETIDYGPCAFMDQYDPETVFSYIDRKGRYRFDNQSNMAQYNIARLCESLLPLISDNQDTAIEKSYEMLEVFNKKFTQKYNTMMSNKLGLDDSKQTLVTHILQIMHDNKLDYTNTFYDLTNKSNKLNIQIKEFLDSVKQDKNTMSKNNPIIIPRNHNVQKAISLAENGNYEYFNLFVEAIKTPYQMTSNTKSFLSPPNDDEVVKNTFCGT